MAVLGKEQIHDIALEKLRLPELSVRGAVDIDKLQELAKSIREQGILDPLHVHRDGNDFVIDSGTRRYRAAKMAGLTHAPCIIRDAPEDTRLQQALITNLQRDAMDPIYEARGLASLKHKKGLTPFQIAQKIGKSESWVESRIRLLDLGPRVQDMIQQQILTPTSAFELLKVPDLNIQEAVAKAVINNALTAEGTKRLVDNVLRVEGPPEQRAQATTEILAQPEVLYPCDSCQLGFPKNALTKFDLCQPCTTEIYEVVLKIRQRVDAEKSKEVTLKDERTVERVVEDSSRAATLPKEPPAREGAGS